MKNKNITLLSLFVGYAALACAGSAVAKRGNDPALEDAVRAVAAAADAQDVARMDKLLHDNFSTHFVVAKAPGEKAVPKKVYLDLLGAKKIGGDQRQVNLLSVERVERLAFARVRLNGKKANFEAQQTWVKADAGWRLLSESVVFAPRG